MDLELYHGLDINNTHHIWLLHHLFLQTLNQQLSFFAESWNLHQLQIRVGPNRSPADMFGFDMLVHGLRGDHLPTEDAEMTDEELEIYGVDWGAFQDTRILQSVRESGQADSGVSSQMRQIGPPSHLNEVPVFPPAAPALDDVATLNAVVTTWIESAGAGATISAIWNYGRAVASTIYGNIF